MKIDGTGPPNTRLNIDDISTKDEYKIRWSLFVRALTAVQAGEVTNSISYYSIAAIHGKPIRTWPELVDGGHLNWCAHGDPKFLPWHRVYLLLLEKVLLDHAVRLARLAPEPVRDQYVAEARKLRIPFWDFGHTHALPAAVLGATVNVIKIADTDLTTIPNPLHSYTFAGTPPTGFPQTTQRYTPEVVTEKLDSSKARETIYHALTMDQGYGAFGNTRFLPAVASIEVPHNNLHNSVGPTMVSPDMAAFDPIFWLFHACLDRYYELWQTLNPTAPWQENQAGAATVDHALVPFSRSEPDGTWTSRMIQFVDSSKLPNAFVFGVQYPEALASMTVFERKKATIDSIVKLYAPPPPPPGRTHASYPRGAIPQTGRALLPGYPTTLPVESCLRREWRVLIKVQDDLVAGNFAVFVFLGEPGPVAEWGSNENSVGVFHTFKANFENCRNCQDHQGEPFHASVYLTEELSDALPANVGLEDKVPVASFLAKELSWRVRKADGTEFHVGASHAAKLSVKVDSYIEAYVPIDSHGHLLDCDSERIVGVTFDHVEHPEITAGGPNYRS